MSTHHKMMETLPSHLGPLARPELSETESISLRELLDIARANAWLIAACAVLGGIIGTGHALLVTPIFEAQALVQVEKPRRAMAGLERLVEGELEATPAQTEIEIMRSRLILGQVVDELDLQLRVEPRRFPVIGRHLARRHGEAELASPRFGAGEYAWGGERVQVERLELDEPLEGQEFVLVAEAPGSYSLLAEDGELLVSGHVGEVAQLARGASEPTLSIVVSTLEARPGTRFRIARRGWLPTVESLRSSLSIRERGIGTGILELRLEGEDPTQLEQVLNQIVATYLRQHVERRSEEARRSLDFLEEKLPALRAELEASEEALNEYRSEHRAVDLGADAQNLLGQLVEVDAELLNLELTRLEHGQRFTSEHPMMRTLSEKERRLRATKAELGRRVDGLPSREQQALRLQREVDVATELYTGLLNTAQELRVLQAGTIGNARILDAAVRPEVPVRPRRAQLGAMGMALGLICGFATIFARHALRRTVRDPEALEQATGLPVYGVIPHSARARRATRRARRRAGYTSLLAREHPVDPAVEGLRGFRTSLHLALLREGEKVIALTSPQKQGGTSFACINAGYLLAEAGLRVLVIDADLRHGSLHTYVGVARAPGLSEVLSGDATLGEAVRLVGASRREGALHDDGDTRSSGLFMLATGALPLNPSELLMSDGLPELVDQARSLFDLVIFDTPPVLGVTDAAIVGAHAGAIFMLVRAGRSETRAIEAGVKRLRQYNLPVTAFLLNDARGSR
jgi:tyrosine-protein kinase Etk/Wzc